MARRSWRVRAHELARAGRTCCYWKPTAVGLRPTIDGLILDFNGVITTDEELHFQAFAQTVSQGGSTFTLRDYERLCKGKSDTEAAATLITSGFFAGEPAALWTAKTREYYRLLASERVRVVSGDTRAFLKALVGAAVPFRVLTASTREDVTEVLRVTGLHRLLDMSSITCHVPSSHRRGAVAAARSSLARCRSVLMVDDTERNISSVQGMGGLFTARVDPAAVGSSSSVADVVVGSLSDLSRIFSFTAPTP